MKFVIPGNTPSPLLLIKADGHKYTKRTGYPGHYDYTYPEDQKPQQGHTWAGEHKPTAEDLNKLPAGTILESTAGKFTKLGNGKFWNGSQEFSATSFTMTSRPMRVVPHQAKPEAPKAPQAAPPKPEPAMTIPAKPEPTQEPKAVIPANPPKPTPIAVDVKAEDKASGEASKQLEAFPSADEAPKQKKGEADDKFQNRQRAWAKGAHIFGSAKDKRDAVALIREGKMGDLSDAEVSLVLNKASLMPTPDMAQMRAAGATPGGAHLALQMAALIAPKPTEDTKAGREAYARGVRLIAGSLPGIKTAADVGELRDELARVVASATVQSSHNDRDEAATEAGRLNAASTASGSQVTYHADRDYSRTYGKDFIVRRNDPEAKSALAALGTRFITQLGLGRIVGDKVFSSGASTGKIWRDAQRLARDADAKGEAGWEHLGVKADAKSAERKGKKTAQVNVVRWRPSISEKPDLTGTKVKVDKGDGDRLKGAFNLKSAQRGESISDTDLDHHLKHTEMGLHDLADVLGIDPKQVSFGGRLGVAFGARGHGKAAAHYEPATEAINLTRNMGAGTLAHEWGHALDNIIAKAAGAGKEGEHGVMATTHTASLPPDLKAAVQAVSDAMHKHPKGQRGDITASKAKVREELAAAKAKHVEAMHTSMAHKMGTPERKEADAAQEGARVEHNKLVAQLNRLSRAGDDASDFAVDSVSHDAGEVGKYMSQPVEMWARAFESYVQDKLEDNGRRNSYLVDGTRVKYPKPQFHTRFLDAPGQPYPQGEERKRINAAFDNLFDVLKKGDHLKKAIAYLGDLKKSQIVFTIPSDLAKGENHKYIRRIPTSGGKRKWIYIYAGDKAAAHGQTFQHGEKIKAAHGGQKGHYHVQSIDNDGHITVKHDETGHTMRIKADKLHKLLVDANTKRDRDTDSKKLAEKHAKEDALPKGPGNRPDAAKFLQAIMHESDAHNSDTAAADRAYLNWKAAGKPKGHKPPPYPGGTLDALTERYEAKGASSLVEALEVALKGKKSWADAADVIEALKDVPGFEDARMPSDVQARQTDQDVERRDLEEAPDEQQVNVEKYGKTVVEAPKEEPKQEAPKAPEPEQDDREGDVLPDEEPGQFFGDAINDEDDNEDQDTPDSYQEAAESDHDAYARYDDEAEQESMGKSMPTPDTTEQDIGNPTGGGMFLNQETHDRPVGDIGSNMAATLKDRAEMNPDVRIRRDKEVYKMRDDGGRTSWIYPLEVGEAQMRDAAEADNNVEKNKADLERGIQQVLHETRNRPQVTAIGPAQREGETVMPDGKSRRKGVPKSQPSKK